jgi:hypothetical protein
VQSKHTISVSTKPAAAQDGYLNYEFNLFVIQRTKVRSQAKLPQGKVRIEVESKLVGPIGGPMDVALRVNGEEVGKGRVPAALSLHFTSNATFDIGTDLDSPVSLDYYDRAPFAFNGRMERRQSPTWLSHEVAWGSA